MDETNYYFRRSDDEHSPGSNEDVHWLATMAIAQELKNIAAELKKLNTTLRVAYTEE
jgi:hypothetical protein